MLSLYRGISAPLTGLAAINAIVFGVYGTLTRMRTSEPTMLWHATAGSIAGISQTVITCPMELIKTRAQLTSSSVLSCFRHLIRTEGSRGLYRGLMATIARDAPAFATYFSCFELILNLTKSSSSSPPSTLHLLLSGGTAGAMSWLVIYPVDVVKSRIQADTRYNSMLQCVRQSFTEEGFGVFMRGFVPTLVRAFPTNAATFAVVTWTLYSYERYYSGQHEIQDDEDILE